MSLWMKMSLLYSSSQPDSVSKKELYILVCYLGYFPVGRTAAGAITLALEKVNSDPNLTTLREGNHSFVYTWKDDQCLDDIGLAAVVDLWANKDHDHLPIDAFIGE